MARPTPSASEIRSLFVDFFVERGHEHISSSPLVPENDPTLLFVNAGMNQFKDVFTGRDERPYKRAVSVQKCLRAGGKHNDLDNVGFTPRHQTFFEMLGNFSFGDYFKQDAIDWGWEFLTERIGLQPDRLVATVYDGTGENAPADDEAYELWTKYLPPERIYRCEAKENFWAMGDTGPCGPCSELNVYKPGGQAPPHAGQAGKGPAHEEDLYLELWNLVFMQYEKHPDGTMTKLPRPSIDTGLGLERVASVTAGQASNYETNLLAPLVGLARDLAGGRTDKGEGPYRVIADHARATAFLIAEGIFPDNAGRSYVLRRIMRRAIRHGTEVGLDEPFLHKVCALVVDMFGDVYPEVGARSATIAEVVQGEEEAFRRTLDRGLRRLNKAIDDGEGEDGQFSPSVAAVLKDTYGFPIDLTGIIVGERGLQLDEAAAEQEVKRLQGQSGGRGAELGSDQAIADAYFAAHREAGDTEFLGYEATQGDATVKWLGGSGSEREVVLDRTPMYAESGGQVGDQGTLTWPGGSASVRDVVKPVAGMHVHFVTLESGALRVGQKVTVAVDAARRDAIRRNHSATHMLHHALRAELGDHVLQKGSLVAPDRLRFDFSHNRPLTAPQRRAIETMVNEMVLRNEETTTQLLSVDEAKKEGAIGLFGQKYGEQVRVVRIAEDSLELCGGTHVRRAGDVGAFAIVTEGGIAQGVRRIEAVTGMGAVEHLQHLADVTGDAMAQLHAPSPHDVAAKIEKLQADLKAKDREIAELQRKIATGAAGSSEDDVAMVDGVKLLTRRVSVADPKALRSAADALRDRLGSGVVVLGAETSGKATLLVAVTKDLKGRVHAGKLVGTLASHVDGRGGGRPDLAQAGGPKLAGLDDALGAAAGSLGEMLGMG